MCSLGALSIGGRSVAVSWVDSGGGEEQLKQRSNTRALHARCAARCESPLLVLVAEVRSQVGCHSVHSTNATDDRAHGAVSAADRPAGSSATSSGAALRC